jgi:predicted transcriptional regulator
LSSNGNSPQVEWRRSKVLELSSQGYTQTEIASVLHVTQPTVNKDLAYLRQGAQDNLQNHIHEVVPIEYRKCMVGMKNNLKETLEIANSVTDPRVKLQARAIVSDCYKFILDMSTNAGVISDALKYVQQKTEEVSTLTTLQKLGERIDAAEGEETTANGIY